MRPRRPNPTAPIEPWSRTRLQALLTASAIACCALLAGVSVLVAQVARPAPDAVPAAAATPAATSEMTLRDRIASEPMASVDPEAATRPDPALTPAPSIRLPYAVEGRGPAGVPVYGHSVEGAVAQLAAIDVAVLEAMDTRLSRDVHQVWVLPGGPALADWDVAVNVAAFLRGARQGSAKDAATVVTVVPAGGMIKGTDGPDWVLACVLLDVRATIAADHRMGWGHCARMQWTAARWQIAPGIPPAVAPSTWPGSKSAAAAGWLTWDSDEQQQVRR